MGLVSFRLLSSIPLSLSLSFPVFRPFSDNMFLLEMIVERNRLTVRVLASFVY